MFRFVVLCAGLLGLGGGGGGAEAHSYSLGGCPQIEPASNFDMGKVNARDVSFVFPSVFSYLPLETLDFAICVVNERCLICFLFSRTQMLGLWYVIQKTSTASHCITYNFTRMDEPDTYELIQDSQHFVLGLTPLKHDYRYVGRLTVPDSAVPARMTVKFPLSK